ncbi:MAG TPA: alpha-1,4-glucan--maltose-1-phosphate maltosyltransferase [Nitrococcus sp.]|nr:alpha-1,4-glucan--maltose-1-phosphate maltosyltransferase [Nitrococcus sp.]
MATATQSDARQRVVIESVAPEVDAGRFPIKRTLGEQVVVEVDAFTDGHDQLACMLCYRKAGAAAWDEVAMQPLGNDRWRGEFPVSELGRYSYTVIAWVDHFRTWCAELEKRDQPGDIALALLIGAELIEAAAARTHIPHAAQLRLHARELRAKGDPLARRLLALDPELARLMARVADRTFATAYEHELAVVVEVARARFSTWYELFPRSCVGDPATHGSLRSCAERLPYIADMGFDVLYLPPIHPIGTTARKGRNNTLHAADDDPGSPWAIGAEAGGHKAVHSQLGTLEDFRHLVRRAREQGLDVALDIAFQCSPDHPYVKQAPQWFRWRPDGTVQYAENPPKKYQDIYPFNFETEDWQGLWEELRSVFLFWIEQGVRIFRVDNPHTKPFAFWEWLITSIKAQHPEIIFLSEAFTRPKVMHRLAKLGFTQSYTYFTWRNSKQELVDYFTELTQTPAREYFWPNLWPNTPDILNEYLQIGGRPAFMARLVLAATLGANYGIYGPAFELCEARPREPGSEEYLNSEKYEIRAWDLQRPDNLKHFITRVNRIRRENPALRHDWSLRFHPVDNEALICYSKHSDRLENVILVIVNLDPHHTHSGWVELPLEALQLPAGRPYQVHDLLSDTRYLWQGARNYVELDPRAAPAHIFRLRRHLRTERDFDYFM